MSAASEAVPAPVPTPGRRAKAKPRLVTVLVVFLASLWSVWVIEFPYSVANLPLLYTTFLLLPGLLTILISRAYRLWYAWLGIAALGWLVYPAALQLVLMLSWTWAAMASIRPFSSRTER